MSVDCRGGTPHSGAGMRRPRVVMLEDGNVVAVEVVDLPPGVDVGAEFDCHGRTWRVVARRTHARVLVAVPVPN